MEEMTEEEVLHKVDVVTGISKNVLGRVVEDCEHLQEIQVFGSARRSSVASKRGKAPRGTSTYLPQYVDRQNEAGRKLTPAEAARWLAIEPGDRNWGTPRTLVHVSRKTVSRWLRALG